jgi:phosphate transport system protein
MNTKKEQSIQDIIKSFQEMAELVLEQLKILEKQMNAENKQDEEELISRLKKNEKEIDRYEISLSDKFINAIVLYNPVASDLRRLVAVYRMTLNLERIGDLVMNIAYTVETLMDSDAYRTMNEMIHNMLGSGMIMVEKSLLSFVNNDIDFAVWTIKNDAIVDDMNQKLLKSTISRARISNKTKEMLLSYADMRNILTNIERIADHATNIAEASIYSMQGTDIRHSGFDKKADSNISETNVNDLNNG